MVSLPTARRIPSSDQRRACCESATMIRNNEPLWRALASPERVKHENFFIAKNPDSESTQRSFRRSPRLAMKARAHLAFSAQITKSAAAQAFPAILIIGNGDDACTSCIVLRTLSRRTPCARSLRRVNTSLSGTLFFSQRWCIRKGVHFDSRMHAATKPSH
jgi:hypothetical protein